jgi:hypothetical protein
VRGKGHLQTCIAGRKDNLRCSILRKDNPKTTIKILGYQEKFQDCNEVRKLDRLVRKIEKSVKRLGKSVWKLGKSVRS